MTMTESRTTEESTRLTELEEDVTETRQAFDEYRAGPQPTSTKLRKLQEASTYAEARLKRAQGPV